MKNIPKTCYLYWNDKPMSLLHVLTVVSFQRLNPDWLIVINLVTNAKEEVDNSNINPKYRDYTGKDYFYMLRDIPNVQIRESYLDPKNKIHSILVSDIWRREILFERGGVYSDFDVIWLKPMSEFVNIDCIGDPSDFDCTVSYYNQTYGFHNVSNIVAEEGSPFLGSLIDITKSIHPPYGDQSFGTDMLNNNYPSWEYIKNRFPRTIALKYETFYPYSTFNLRQLFSDDTLTPIQSKNVMCVHWFNGNEWAKEYINQEAYDRPCSMTSILKQEGLI